MKFLLFAVKPVWLFAAPVCFIAGAAQAIECKGLLPANNSPQAVRGFVLKIERSGFDNALGVPVELTFSEISINRKSSISLLSAKEPKELLYKVRGRYLQESNNTVLKWHSTQLELSRRSSGIVGVGNVLVGSLTLPKFQIENLKLVCPVKS